MSEHEACEWVHTQLIIGEMRFDDLVAAFTALAGRVPDGPDHQEGLFRKCYEIVTSLTGVSDALRSATTARARTSSLN